MAANAPISHPLNCVHAMQSNNLLAPLLIGQDKLFQQLPDTNKQLRRHTERSKVETLQENEKSSFTWSEHLSSTESFAVQLNGGFGRAHHADASTEVHCQTVQHTPRPDLRCPEWSATHASFDTATLLLGPFPHGFSLANVHPR